MFPLNLFQVPCFHKIFYDKMFQTLHFPGGTTTKPTCSAYSTNCCRLTNKHKQIQINTNKYKYKYKSSNIHFSFAINAVISLCDQYQFCEIITFLQVEAFCDVTLAVDGASIKCHKMVSSLSKRCKSTDAKLVP